MIEFMPRDWYNLKMQRYQYTKLDYWIINHCNFKIGKWSLFHWKTVIQCRVSKKHMPLIMGSTSPQDEFYARLFCSRCGIELDRISFSGHVDK